MDVFDVECVTVSVVVEIVLDVFVNVLVVDEVKVLVVEVVLYHG